MARFTDQEKQQVIRCANLMIERAAKTNYSGDVKESGAKLAYDSIKRANAAYKKHFKRGKK